MSRRQKFHGHGKLLLSGEYFVLDGALSLALPTTVGQSLEVIYRPSYTPGLHWKCFDCNSQIWFEAQFELWHFEIVETIHLERAKILQTILRQARKQNSHFLREEALIEAKSHLEFPLDWGLGTSSTLTYNVAQWAYVSPFELQFKTMGGSGYDIACAQSDSAIFYRKREDVPEWAMIPFAPIFKNNLFFIHLGKKQSTSSSIALYKDKVAQKNLCPSDIQEIIQKISSITEELVSSVQLADFEELIVQHEEIIARFMDLTPVKERLFPDFWGEIKSLGAWGGDFVMATSDRPFMETKSYFQNKGLDVCIPYCELIKTASSSVNNINNTYSVNKSR